MRRLLILGLLLAWLLPRGAAADEDFVRLRALADAKHAAHAEATAWWAKRADDQKVALLRRALASEDETLAVLGARGIGWPYLDAAETARKVDLLLADTARDVHARPKWALLQERPLGSREVVAYVGWAVAEPDRFPGGSIQTAHRVMQGDQIEPLLPWVARAPAASLRDVLFLVGNTGEADREDRHRRVVAEGLLNGLRRIRALRKGDEPPRWTSLLRETDASWREGLPPSLVELARATHTDRKDGFARTQAERDETEASVRPFHVLRRWLLDTKPSADDQTFLHEVVKLGLGKDRDIYAPVHVLWAMDHLAGMPGPKGKDAIVGWARGADGPTRIVEAATTLARLEDRSHFDRVRKAIDDGTFPREHRPHVDYTWLVDRDEARARAVKRLLEPNAGPITDGDVLAVARRPFVARDFGIRIGRPDLDVIAKGLWDAEAKDREHVFRLLHFHAHIDPASLTVDRAKALLKRLRRWLERADRSADEPWTYRDEETLDRALALLEVRAPDATATLLRWWVMNVDEGRMYALERFARLGRAGLEDETIALWEDEEFGWHERWLLGRTPGDEIDFFLRHKGIPDVDACTQDQIVETFDALHALFLRQELPRSIAPLLEPLRLAAEDEPEAYAVLVDKAYRATNSGDAIAGVLVLAEAAEHGIHALGGIDDDRVRRWLRARRADRASGLYWEATLALAGSDPEAAGELLHLIRQGRTWLLENLEGGGIAHGPRQAFSEALTAGLDTNCCLGWICHVLLKEMHPWLPYDDGFGGAGTRATRVLLGRHAWKRSEIFDGPVPAVR